MSPPTKIRNEHLLLICHPQTGRNRHLAPPVRRDRPDAASVMPVASATVIA
jgi:hypothetical protein